MTIQSAGDRPAVAVQGNAGRASRLLPLEVLLAAAAFAVLCAVVLRVAPQLSADGYAYRASIIALTEGHLGTLSGAEVRALAARLDRCPPPARACQFGPGIEFWVRLPGGRWISEKDPGYPFLAVPFQWLGLIRLAPLFYGALGCLGLFSGARRWIGPFGGTAAVALFCSSGVALLFAWQDYWPAFTDASLIAAGTGALVWAMLGDGCARRRTWAGLAGFLSIEAAVFVRYTDIIVLGCAVAAVLAARLRNHASVPRRALAWWLGSVLLFAAGVAVFDDVIYGGPFRSGYRPGEVTFSLSAILPNLRYVPAQLIQAMPVLALGLASLAWIAVRRVRAVRAGGERAAIARRDFAVGMALAASWLGVWALYATYTWTARPGIGTGPTARFYLPAAGAIALLGARLLRAPGTAGASRRASLVTAVVSACLAVMLFAYGTWSFRHMLDQMNPAAPPPHGCDIGERHCPATPPPAASSLPLVARRARGPDRQPAVVHRDDPPGLRGDPPVVGDQDPRERPLPPQGLEQVNDVVAGVFVKVACRLVCEQHARGLDQRACDRDSLLLAAGKLTWQVVSPVGQADRVERGLRQPAACLGAGAQRYQCRLHVV